MKKIIKLPLIFIGALSLLVLIYVSYLLIDYHRLPDNQALTAVNRKNSEVEKNQRTAYQVTSFNIGYAAYPADYSFFMDGGKYSRAYNKETVMTNLKGITDNLSHLNSDIIMLQEVDTKGDRSMDVDEVAYITNQLAPYHYVFGQNYDSSYLFYPITQPIGAATSGLLSLSRTPIEQSTRYSLPIETDFNKFFDLDRAFTVSRTTLDGHPLTFINVHLSAFTKDTTILDNQIKKLGQYMTRAYKAGQSVIVAGDFNHDMLGNSPEVFNTDTIPRTWTHPFPVELLPEHFTIPKGSLDKDNIPSVRSNGEPYKADKSFVSIVDGFIVSDNINVKDVTVLDLSFNYSDHQPITLSFEFKP
ncbi:endonuclease/exonuclease/phosphatase family protein [Vagococcus xieshaowenii]|uniref:Hydrolase n=1 Tax=Vagococcus xieshaowenii TaxID=2562451 RepID=A0AAJ5EGW7_9ENTE|nr:endonuclease/exonuclease/phosphatase family protein [Vagococcus xieshaowenii]QCA28766.1 hydrolase [Vagococcus xieshaowenii]TFZ43033.1 hydrolase [Vagococcus xieshaowenii]